VSTFLSNAGHQSVVFVSSSAHLTHSVVVISMPSISSVSISNSIHCLEFSEQFHIRIISRRVKDSTLMHPLLFVCNIIMY